MENYPTLWTLMFPSEQFPVPSYPILTISPIAFAVNNLLRICALTSAGSAPSTKKYFWPGEAHGGATKSFVLSENKNFS